MQLEFVFASICYHMQFSTSERAPAVCDRRRSSFFTGVGTVEYFSFPSAASFRISSIARSTGIRTTPFVFVDVAVGLQLRIFTRGRSPVLPTAWTACTFSFHARPSTFVVNSDAEEYDHQDERRSRR